MSVFKTARCQAQSKTHLWRERASRKFVEYVRLIELLTWLCTPGQETSDATRLSHFFVFEDESEGEHV